MKNILTFLTLLTLFFSVGWAETAEFDVLLGGFTDGENCFYKTVNGITLTFAKGTGQNLPNITGGTMGGDAHVVFHRGNTITVEGGTSTITEVELSFYIYQPGESWGVSSGSYSVTQINSSWTGTWTGAAPTVTLTNNSEQNANIFHVKVTYRPKVQTPVITINPDAATHYVGDNVTASIACGTADATILYKINDGEWTECNGSVNFTSETPGNVTIQAIAKKDGCNNSEVAEKTITFVPIPVLNNLAEVNALKDGDKFKFEADITASPVVLGKRNNDLYIVMPDNSAGALVYKAGVYWDDTYTYGKIINSGWTGEKTTYNGRPEVRNTENFSVSDVSSDLVAIQILSNSDLSLRNFGRFAVIKGVKVAPAGSFNELTTYDEFGVMSQVVDEGKYDVSGVIGWENGTGVFMPLWYNNYEPAHTITVTQPVGGTISADIDKAYSGERVNLTANPAAAYQFGSWIVKDENDNGVAVTENHFTMPKSDVTVTAQFTLKPTYAITVEGGTANPTAAYEGQTVTVTPTIPEGKLFDSYTVTPNSVTLTESGNGYTFTMPAEPVTVTFNYKDDPAWTNHFERITSTDQLVAGVRYLLVYETRPAVLGGIVGDNPKYGSAVTSSSDFSYNNGVVNLTSNSAAMPVILGGATGAWTFKTGGKYLYSATGGGLNTQEANNNNGIWSISFEGSNAVITNHNGETSLTIYYNDSKQGFAGYSSTSSGQALHPIQLYKEIGPDTWTVAGDAALCGGEGYSWNTTAKENDMVLDNNTGLYTWTKQNVDLSGNVEFKVVKNHKWDEAYPSQNYKIFIYSHQKYNVTITYNPTTHEVKAVAEVAEYVDEFTVVGSSSLFGSNWDVNDVNNNMTSTDGKIFTLTKENKSLNEDVRLKVVKNHGYTGEGYGSWPASDYILYILPDVGNYDVTITFNYQTGEVNATAIPYASLADLCSAGNNGVNKTYKISDELLVVDYFTSGDAIFLQCKDQGDVSIDKSYPATGQKDFMKLEGQQSTDWDQSNWIALWLQGGTTAEMLARAQAAKGHKISGVIGYYSDANNYTMKVQYNDFTIGDGASYTPNVYCVANFNPANLGTEGTYFFMNPKVQEICHITYAQWDGSTFTVPSNSDFEGTLALDYAFNTVQSPTMTEGKLYEFDAIVQRTVNGNGAPALKLNNGEAYRVSPTNLKGSENEYTAISTVGVNGEVKSVKYVNVAGVVSDRPFQGVNIVVTEYTDGTRTTAKVVK